MSNTFEVEVDCLLAQCFTVESTVTIFHKTQLKTSICSEWASELMLNVALYLPEV